MSKRFRVNVHFGTFTKAMIGDSSLLRLPIPSRLSPEVDSSIDGTPRRGGVQNNQCHSSVNTGLIAPIYYYYISYSCNIDVQIHTENSIL